MCFVRTGQIPAWYQHCWGRLFSWDWSECGWTGWGEAGERLEGQMALMKRWRSLSEQYGSLFPFFWLLLFNYFLFSLVLHGKPNSMRQHGLQNTICRFFVKWRKWKRREFHLMHYILLQQICENWQDLQPSSLPLNDVKTRHFVFYPKTGQENLGFQSWVC